MVLQITIFDTKIEYFLPQKNLPIWDPNLPTKNCRFPYLSSRKDHTYACLICDMSEARTHSSEMQFRALKISGFNHSATGAT